ncbi:tetratricopeptide (TPR) repeat protein [Streptacidiphilus sp. MAP12-33]|uniref:hypothetical protein n=1 Tax=Streptacidiphilus sp. MAP12-33 TaxID=3156266 RepID=UPI0035119D98
MGLFDRRRRANAEAEARANVATFVALRNAEQVRTAEPRIRSAVDRAAAALGGGHMLTLRLRELLGQALADQGRGEDALREYRTVADTAGRDGEQLVERLAAHSNLAGQLCMEQRYEEAEREARRLLAEVERLPVDMRVYPRLSALNSVGRALVGLERPAEAEQLLRAALAESASATLPVGSFQRILDVNLASALSAQERHDEALARLDAAAAIVDPSGARAGASAIGMGRATALLGLGRHAEAAEAARAGLDAALVAFDEPHPRVRRLRALLAEAEAAVTATR